MKLKIFLGLLIAFAMALSHKAEAQKVKEVENLKQIVELQSYAIELCAAKYDSLLFNYNRLDKMTADKNIEILAIVNNIRTEAKEAESAFIAEAKRKEIECNNCIEEIRHQAKAAEAVYISNQKKQARKYKRQKIMFAIGAFGVGILSGFIIQ